MIIAGMAEHSVIPNIAKHRLANDELVLCLALRHARTVDTARIVQSCGYDAVYVDMEHSTITQDAAAQICNAALNCGVTPLVRLRGLGADHITGALDGGAMGLIAPQMDTPEQGHEVARAARFPPAGVRGAGPPYAQLGFQRMSVAEAARAMNETTLVVALIESAEGVANADKIAAVEGIDILTIGAADLRADMGIDDPADFDAVDQAMEALASACRNHGKILGAANNPTNIKKTAQYIEMGARFISVVNDLSFLMDAIGRRAKELREIKPD